MGAPPTPIGAAMFEVFAYDEEGNLLTPNFYDYHVPHTLDMPSLKTAAIESPSPFTPLGTKGMGEAAAADPLHLRRAPGRVARGRRRARDVDEPYHRVWEMLRHPERSREKVEVISK